jgi:hypothetical protein
MEIRTYKKNIRRSQKKTLFQKIKRSSCHILNLVEQLLYENLEM